KNGLEVVCANVSSFGVESPPAPDVHAVVNNVGNVIALKTASVPKALSISRLVAFDPSTNKIVWKHDDISTGGLAAGASAPCSSPTTITAGGIVIIGRVVANSTYPTGAGYIQAYDIKTGNLVWQIPMLVNGSAAPVVPRLSVYSVGGKEYIASFTHSTVLGGDISVFT